LTVFREGVLPLLNVHLKLSVDAFNQRIASEALTLLALFANKDTTLNSSRLDCLPLVGIEPLEQQFVEISVLRKKWNIEREVSQARHPTNNNNSNEQADLDTFYKRRPKSRLI